MTRQIDVNKAVIARFFATAGKGGCIWPFRTPADPFARTERAA